MVHAFCVLRNLCLCKGQKDFFLCYLLELYLKFQLLHLLSIFSYSPQGPPSVFLRSIIAPPIKLKSKSQTCHLPPWPSLFMWSITKSYPFYSLKSTMDIFFNILLYHHLNLDLLQQPPKWSLCQSPEPPPDSFSYCYGFKNRNSEKSSVASPNSQIPASCIAYIFPHSHWIPHSAVVFQSPIWPCQALIPWP